MPRHFRDSVAGLCGTFTADQVFSAHKESLCKSCADDGGSIMVDISLSLASREMTLRLLKATWKIIRRILQTSENLIIVETSPELKRKYN